MRFRSNRTPEAMTQAPIWNSGKSSACSTSCPPPAYQSPFHSDRCGPANRIHVHSVPYRELRMQPVWRLLKRNGNRTRSLK